MGLEKSFNYKFQNWVEKEISICRYRNVIQTKLISYKVYDLIQTIQFTHLKLNSKWIARNMIVKMTADKIRGIKLNAFCFITLIISDMILYLWYWMEHTFNPIIYGGFNQWYLMLTMIFETNLGKVREYHA